MIQAHEVIADPLSDPIGRHIAKIRSIPHWTAAKQQLVAELTRQLTRRRYVQFHADYRKVLLERIGASLTYQVPPDKRGHLRRFRGQRIRLVCVAVPQRVLRRPQPEKPLHGADRYRYTGGSLRTIMAGVVKF